jgi:threonine/homoserine/homoserine lactone efflux protein
MTLSIMSAFVLASLAYLLTPGPVVAILGRNALRDGWSGGFTTCSGVIAGRFTVATVAIVTLVQSSQSALQSVRWISLAGAIYLGWMAIRILRPLKAGSKLEAAARRSRPLLEGYAVAISNPASVLFYLGFLPMFVDFNRPAFSQFIVLAAIYLTLAYVVALGWLAAFCSLGPRLRASRFAHVGKWLSAAIYLAIAGAAMANAVMGMAAGQA